jgi:transmembrane 9 superfamily protein 3
VINNSQTLHYPLFCPSQVGPYTNPQEAYHYYSLPYCAPDNEHHPDNPNPKENEGLFNKLRSNSIGEYLSGNTLRHSGHSIEYAQKKSHEESCTATPLTEADAAKFITAVSDNWFYQMYLDDLPVWGKVGELKNGKPFVYTKRTLVITYNGNRIIEADIISDPDSLREVKVGGTLSFSTKFMWEKTDKEFHSRFEKFLDKPFFKHHIHWFSIFNSFMMVIFLMGLVALILVRTLRKDYARYAVSGGDLEDGYYDDSDEEDDDVHDKESKPLKGGVGVPSEDSGWKLVSGDVFRAPSMLALFSSILGTGWQLLVLTLGVILFAVAGPIHGEVHEDRGEMHHAIVYCYCFSSIVSGYVSGSYYKLYSGSNAGRNKSAGSNWQLTMFLTVMLFPTIVTMILSVLNAIALSYGTVYYVPFLVIIKVFFLWVFVSVPLCILGTLLGRHAKIRHAGAKGGTGGCFTSTDFPCRVNAIARPIPEPPTWYGNPINIIPFAGLLAFGSIFIELYYVLTSLWSYKFYHVYGFLLGVYAILAIVVSTTTIIVVYFCLNAENYLWQWTAFFSGGSTAVYIFLYSVYYFLSKTEMSGFIQTMFYFGYMSLVALTIGALCGTIGHLAANRFVRTIFQNVKVD